MFDRLIVSEPAGAHIRSRRNYFFVSTLAVGTLLLSAVVFSIFAEELSLGTDSFELSVMVMPVDPPVQPEPPRPRLPATNTPTASASQLPTRQVEMSRPDEPTIVPNTTSTAANTRLSRPLYAPYQVTGTDSNPGVPSGTGRDTGSTGNGPEGLSTGPQVAETTPDVDPPPVRHVEPPKTPPTQSLGVVNGRATDLPKPVYPATAIAVRAQGKVDVQVLINEAGRVVSAKAVSGNPLLRDAAERAARNARFSPTLLSNVPVKVTGVIVYNFTRG